MTDQSDGRRALIEVATHLIAKSGIPEPVARACVIADPALQDLALPVAAVCQRLLREMQEPLDRLNAVLAESGTSMAEFSASTEALTARQQRKTR